MGNPNIDFPAITEPVTLELFGQPSSRSDAELRYGSKGSLSIDLQKSAYYDHEAGKGGGLLDLIQTKTGEEPITWLKEHHFIDRELSRIPGPVISNQANYIYNDETGRRQAHEAQESLSFLRHRRSLGTPTGSIPGPRYAKLGKAVRYRREDLGAWLEEHLQKVF